MTDDQHINREDLAPYLEELLYRMALREHRRHGALIDGCHDCEVRRAKNELVHAMSHAESWFTIPAFNGAYRIQYEHNHVHIYRIDDPLIELIAP